MTQEHPITPPPELVEQWYDSISGDSTSWKQELATQAARWGADQELEACCSQLAYWGAHGYKLHDARRPKPPSLKEQALKRLTEAERTLIVDPDGIIRRALEQLDD